MTTERQHTLVPCATCGTGDQPKHMVSVGDDWLCTQCAGAEIGRLRGVFHQIRGLSGLKCNLPSHRRVYEQLTSAIGGEMP